MCCFCITSMSWCSLVFRWVCPGTIQNTTTQVLLLCDVLSEVLLRWSICDFVHKSPFCETSGCTHTELIYKFSIYSNLHLKFIAWYIVSYCSIGYYVRLSECGHSVCINFGDYFAKQEFFSTQTLCTIGRNLWTVLVQTSTGT